MTNYNQRKLSFLLLLFFQLSCVFVASASAQSDPSIRDWGSPPGTPPPWQTPDIWVDNNGNGVVNEPLEPSRGTHNRLFARIRNLGPTPATNVTVRFAYAPYGVWGWASYSDFKQIDAPSVPSLGAMGTADGEKTIEVDWDLSDLSENNGGAWGGFSVNDFDHFCVWVKLEFPGDSNAGNNDARNNFINVGVIEGFSASIKFLVINPKNKAGTGRLIIRGIPDDWRPVLDANIDPRQFVLKPKEYRAVTLTFTPPARAQGRPQGQGKDTVGVIGPVKQHGDITFMLDGDPVPIGGVSFDVTVGQDVARPFPPSGGILSPYIIGTYDLRGGRRTFLQIVNPTGNFLRVLVAFFDDNEKPLKCLRDRLSPNDLLEVDVRRQLDNMGTGFGVVKIVSFNDVAEVPQPGVVGYQRTFSRSLFRGDRLKAESILQPVPSELLNDDMKFIRQACK